MDDTPLPWSTKDALYAALICGGLVAIFHPQTWVWIAELVQVLVPGLVLT